MAFDRRGFLKASASGLAAAGTGSILSAVASAADSDLGPSALPSGALESAPLDALPGKVPLIKKSYRPPNFETPVRYFNEPFTSNDAFFVRYHLAAIPQVEGAQWRPSRRRRSGRESRYELVLEQLKHDFEAVEIGRGMPMLGKSARAVRNPTCPESNGATAPWAMPSGRAQG